MDRLVDINETFHFGLHKLNPQRTEAALSYYEKHQLKNEDWLYDKDGIDIFLDTNVLLNLYGASKRVREAFLKFMLDNADRIYITHQVSDEYMNHRVQAIHNGPKTIEQLHKSLNDYCDSFITAFQNIEKTLISKTEDRGLLNDMQETKAGLRKLLEAIQKDLKSGYENYEPILKEIKKHITKEINELKKDVVTEEKDNIIKCVCQMQLLPILKQQEKMYLNQLYDSLWKGCEKYNNDGELRDIYAFPGRGDHTKEDPYGDFYIYHEIMAYMLDNQKDAVFITGDITKADWIKHDGNPYLQYVIDSYANTGHVLFIMDINRLSMGLHSIVNEVEDAEPEDGAEKGPSIGDATPLEPCSAEEDLPNEDPQNKNSQLYQALIYSYLSKVLKNRETAIPNSNQIQTPRHREISEERFLSELACSEKWAETYGNGYVSMNYFIHDILGNKDFDYQKSYEMLDRLIAERKIIRKDQNADGHTFTSISRAKQK